MSFAAGSHFQQSVELHINDLMMFSIDHDAAVCGCPGSDHQEWFLWQQRIQISNQ